ncbi:MAG TPA: cytochrome c peroxidase [Thermoanaerobaculia bacterium]
MKRLIAIALIGSAVAMPLLSGGDLPPGFPPPIAGANVQTEAKFQLGRQLFYDRRLSYNGTQSCADCHQQKLAFTDGRPRAIGSTGQQHTRNAMTLTNAAYNATYTWTGTSVRTLEQQALVPMLNEHPIELGVRNHQREIVSRLESDPACVSRFRAAFPGERHPVSLRNIAKALASFERELISGHSPYDQLVYGGDERALSPEAWRGMNLFYSPRAGCSGCHRGFNFSGDVRYAGSRNARPRLASNGVTTGEFRVPTLRNIALTAPYMHDGSLATLEAVIDRYSEARRLGLSAEEKGDLVAFLKSLTDVSFVTNPRLGDPRPDR